MITKPLVTYDEEVYPNCFLIGFKFHGHPGVQAFEISSRKNQRTELQTYLSYLQNIDAHLVGYNNDGFDSPILHEFMRNPLTFTASKAYDMAQKIIDFQKVKSGFSPYKVALKDRLLHQIDLMKIWHFDNEAKRTRLKDLQFAMRSPTVEDLPFPVGKILSDQEIEITASYMCHDITETEKFLDFTMDRLKLRFDLLNNGILKGDVLNYNDTKIGEQFLVTRMGRNNCYSGSKAKGTDRLRVNFAEIISPRIQFRSTEFGEVLETFKGKTWLKGDSDHNKLISFQKPLAGITFKFGSGGVHASVERKVFRESSTHKIIDIDVSSYYPSVCIANRIYPEHLGELFLRCYHQLKIDRENHVKGSIMNAILKLAQNGAFGKMNSEFSPFFDIKALFSITINGQLLLTILAEALHFAIPDLQIIQVNTDGITAYVPRAYEWIFEAVKKEWEQLTTLKLEQVEYKAMFIRDVNNYISVKMDGKTKLKGAYWYPKSWKDYDEGPGHWHTDLSMLIVPKIAEQVMLHQYDPEFLIRHASDPFDFMIRHKVIGAQKAFIGNTETQRTSRYYVSTLGQPMKVIRPASGPVGQFKRKPKVADKLYENVLKEIGLGVWDARIHTGNKSVYEDTVTSIQSGWKVRDCNDARNFNWADVDYKFYLEEIKKLIIEG